MKNPNNIINETNEDVEKFMNENPLIHVFIETSILRNYFEATGEFDRETALTILSVFARFLLHGMEGENIAHVAIEFERILQELTMRSKNICDCHKRRSQEFNFEKLLRTEN